MIVDTPMTDENFQFFYVIYFNGTGPGSLIIPQAKMENGEPCPDGFNIAEAHQYLASLFGRLVLVTHWYPTTRRRYDEFANFCSKSSEVEQAKPHLSLVPKEKPNDHPVSSPTDPDRSD